MPKRAPAKMPPTAKGQLGARTDPADRPWPMATAREYAAQAGLLALPMADLKKDTDHACLYHCDFADERRFS